MTERLERQLIELVAADRLYIPVSSLDGKLKRMRSKIAKAIVLPDNSFEGERVYAQITTEDENKARGMREGIDLFNRQFPKYGKILQGMIEEQRAVRETHMYFGMNEGCKLTSNDYCGVMKELGFGPVSANNLYHELVEVSRNIKRKRKENGDRRIMLDTTLA